MGVPLGQVFRGLTPATPARSRRAFLTSPSRPSGFLLPSVRVCLLGTEYQLGFRKMEEVVVVRN